MQTIKLHKNDKLLVGLSWKNLSDSQSLDMDLMAISLDKNKNFLNKADLIFYNNLFSRTGALFHTGDNKTGNSSLDDEVILVNLSYIPKNIKYIKFAIFNHCPKNKFSEVSFRIAKIDNIFDTEGSDIFYHRFENSDFRFIYIFEIQITDDYTYNINIKLREIKNSIEELCKMYNIRPESLNTM